MFLHICYSTFYELILLIYTIWTFSLLFFSIYMFFYRPFRCFCSPISSPSLLFPWIFYFWPFSIAIWLIFKLFFYLFLCIFHPNYSPEEDAFCLTKNENIFVSLQKHLGLNARKPVFGGLRTTKAQISLRICAVWSAPLIFAYWNVGYLDLLRAKFQYSI